ncbi:hypothetical protein L6Q96_06010 [Candidatus Binatia bacterium]|nr:hypothetical protein [Candidatus Binatia bacterium]
MPSPLLQTAARAILPIALLLSVHMLVRGHNLPGGGFVAGLMTASALVLQFVAAPRRLVERALPCTPTTVLWLGLAVGLASTLAPLLLGHQLLTHTFGGIAVPVLGYFKQSTAMLFDIGVYLVVTGATLTILIAIED